MKDNKIVLMIIGWLSGFIDAFKQKNPVAFIAIQAVLVAIHEMLVGILLQTGFVDPQLCLPFNICFPAAQSSLTFVMLLLMIVGAHTPAPSKLLHGSLPEKTPEQPSPPAQ